MVKKKIPRGREHDTILDLDKNGMVGSEGWKKPRIKRRKKNP
jgi:hypothetical protein